MPKPVLGPQRRTNPLIWCLAIICAILAVIVIIVGIIVFAGFLAIRPKLPSINVSAARLDTIRYDQAGLLAVQVSVAMKAENDNLKAHASFYDTSFILSLQGLQIAQLVADPFDVQKNDSIVFNYLVESSPIPLSPQEQAVVQESLSRNKEIMFYLKGTARTRWRVGPLGSVKFWLHLNCQLLLPINGSTVGSHCSSKSH